MAPKKNSKSASSAFTCTSCTKPFASAKALSDHFRSKHTIFATTSGSTATEKPINMPNTIPTKNVGLEAPSVMKETTVAWNTLTSDVESSLHTRIPSWSNVQDLSSTPRPFKQTQFIRERTQMTNTPRSKTSKQQVPKQQIPEPQVPRPQVPNPKAPNTKALNPKSPRPKAPQPIATTSKAQTPKTHPVPEWSAIPDSKQPAALTALIMHCHTRPVLTANEYKFGTTLPIPFNTNAAHPSPPKRTAITLDCEMVGVAPNNTSSLARFSVIDYLTNEILIDTLVQPTESVTDWRTRYSGITRGAMATAVLHGRALKGSAEARVELFKYVDSDTVFVGHALQHDLLALGIRHDRIVDSAILATEAVGKGVKRRWGLKDLASQLLDIKIQGGDKVGHDSVEDAFAAREIVLWCIEHPNKLRIWAERKRKERYGKSKKTTVKKGVSSRGFRLSSSTPRWCGCVGDEDVLTWSDFAGDCGDGNYDPWSD